MTCPFCRYGEAVPCSGAAQCGKDSTQFSTVNSSVTWSACPWRGSGCRSLLNSLEPSQGCNSPGQSDAMALRTVWCDSKSAHLVLVVCPHCGHQNPWCLGSCSCEGSWARQQRRGTSPPLSLSFSCPECLLQVSRDSCPLAHPSQSGLCSGRSSS